MKTDLATAIIATVIGFAISFFITANIIIKDPSQASIKTLTNPVDTSLSEPDEEIFNYRAINPTVEAYVDCTNYDYAGNCIKQETGE